MKAQRMRRASKGRLQLSRPDPRGWLPYRRSRPARTHALGRRGSVGFGWASPASAGRRGARGLPHRRRQGVPGQEDRTSKAAALQPRPIGVSTAIGVRRTRLARNPRCLVLDARSPSSESYAGDATVSGAYLAQLCACTEGPAASHGVSNSRTRWLTTPPLSRSACSLNR